MRLVRSFACLVALLAGLSPALRGADQPKGRAEPSEISYYRDIRPIFAQHCQGCHQPAKSKGGFVMTSYADLLKKTESDALGIVPGKLAESSVFEQITSKDGKPPKMPEGREPLPTREVQLIRRWIEQGAKDDTPATTKVIVDAAHPPVYELPPVVSAIAYSPDGTLLAVSGYHEVLLQKADGSGLVDRLVGLSERIQSIAFSSDGKRLAVVGGSPARFGELQIWDVEKKKLDVSQTYTFDTLYGVSWSQDGKQIAFGCSDNSVRTADAETGKQILFQGAHNDWVMGTTFSTDGQFLVSVSRDRSMKLIEVATQRFIDNITSITPGALKGGNLAVALKPKKDNTMSKVPPDTPKAKPYPYEELLVGGSDGAPRLYKMHRETKRVIGDDANKVREYEPLPGRIFSLAWNADGSQFVVGSSLNETGEARIYQLDGKRLANCEGIKSGVYAVAFHPNGKQVAIAGFDGTVRLCDAVTGKLVKEFVPVPMK
jgi:WD40 repeat protein/mono/diheme cytochrome c family protein